jgi:hypothetical protein
MSTTRDNSGSISKNEKKEEDRHPDIKGQAVVDGRAYWVAGWLKENDRGKWYSLAFTPKDDQPKAATKPAGGGAALDDDIPFAAEWR